MSRSKTDPEPPSFVILSPDRWTDYELLDSGAGRKLERYGPYTFDRPEHRAVWRRALSDGAWSQADAIFQPTGEEHGGRWQFNRRVERDWVMGYHGLKFQVRAAAARHMDVFPEQAVHWDWLAERIRTAGRDVRVLNLFAYTGLATLAAAQAGAQVTHVDASKRSVRQASDNLALSGLGDRPVRWIVEDAFKYVQRELRRGSRYEAVIMDPPKFGRGPDGQVWEFFDALPELLDSCRQLLSPEPLFIIVTAYAVQVSALSIAYALQEMISGLGGKTTAGELALSERSAGRLLSTALFARWDSLGLE